MKFYLDNKLINNKRIQNGIIVNETLDETLDSGEFSFMIENNDVPYKPKTKVCIEDDNGVKQYFIISRDKVSLSSTNNLTYVHNITLKEETELLKDYTFKNSVLKQPAKKIQRTTVATNTELTAANVAVDKLFTFGKYKVKNITGSFKSFYAKTYKNEGGSPSAGVSNKQYYEIEDRKNATASFNVSILPNAGIIYRSNENLPFDFKFSIDTFEYKEQSSINISFKHKESAPMNEVAIYANDFYSYILNLEFEVYQYTLYDIVQIIANRCRNRFKLSSDLDFLKDIIAPDFTFTQATAYSALVEVFSYINAFPRLNNDFLTLEYFIPQKEKTLANSVITQINKSLSNANYINSLIAEFKNAGSGNIEVFPQSSNEARCKPDNIGIPTETNWCMEVDKPIREIISLKIDSSDFEKDAMLNLNFPNKGFLTCYYRWNAATSAYTNKVLIDVSNYVFEDTNYTQLPNFANVESAQSYKGYSQNYSFHYSKKDNKIYYNSLNKNILGMKFYSTSHVVASALVNQVLGVPKSENVVINASDEAIPYTNVYFTCEYIPFLEGKMEIFNPYTKNGGEKYISQGNGGSDTTRVGRNLLGQNLRMGNEETAVKVKFSNYENRYKKGDVYKNEYFVNVATTTIFKDFCSQTLQLTKNFNNISPFIRLNQEKRFNEIDVNVVEKSEEIKPFNIEFSLTKGENTPQDLLALKTTLLDGIMATLNSDVNYISPLQIALFENSELDYLVAIPLTKYGAANMLCYEMAFASANSAGTTLVEEETFFGTKYFSKYCLYTNSQGTLDNYSIYLGDLHRVIRNYPYVPSDYINYFETLCIFNEDSDKQSNEIFAINYEFIFTSQDNKFIFGNEFIINNKNVVNKTINNIYLYTSNSEYSIIESKVKENSTKKLFTGFNLNENESSLISKDTIGSTDCTSWALGDNDGNILIACNQYLSANSKIKFYIEVHKRSLE